ncbi:hypothetical protein JN11_03920 [Mucilaginibacter frigoritolerans]|uniref:Lipoprotein n=1 Tax=Mucilaginibacter frigoritolerans TaxID=652788 RepID=A0A562TTA3_9SPHI|nr:hypothetical protein [Mucilaginibacter frigoritolerans]TWI96807.1 hypothetical protein JN11_03920 [Mucilaginibacter frigoritolerans]
MNSTIKYAVLAMSITLSACNKPKAVYDTTMTVLVDQTDRLPVYPTVDMLLAPFNLDQNPAQGIEIKLCAISDKDVNKTETVSLPKEDVWQGNPIIRHARIEQFKEELQKHLSSLDSIRTFQHSIIFRNIAEQATLLSKRDVQRRILLIFSNLMENSEVRFYNPQTLVLLEKSPSLIEKQLESTAPLPDLAGEQVWFLYAPYSYRQNYAYMRVAHFYENIYRAHNTTVHIETQFMPL